MRNEKTGLYLNGKQVAGDYYGACCHLFGMDEIPNGFAVDTDYEALGYSVIEAAGVQHVYELSPTGFYDALMNLE